MLAHAFAAAGLILLTVLPGVLQKPFAGLMAAVVIYAVGGGLIEVLISPMVEATPSENKEKMMSLLHSFYCWGAGGRRAAFHAVFSAFRHGELAGSRADLGGPAGRERRGFPARADRLLRGRGAGRACAAQPAHQKKIFWVLLLLMLCAGASEQAVSQWASTFAENALGIGKTAGDLAGPMALRC